MTKTIFITGVTAGIGAATARRFVDQGWQVVGTGRRRDRLDALVAEFGDFFCPMILLLPCRHCRNGIGPSTCC
jgi:serine 3-dehydrogenase